MNDENISLSSSAKDELKKTDTNENVKNTSVFKKIVAWICIIFLALMYITSLVLALLGHGITSNLLMACILGTLVVPILGFIIIWLYSRYNDFRAPGDPTK